MNDNRSRDSVRVSGAWVEVSHAFASAACAVSIPAVRIVMAHRIMRSGVSSKAIAVASSILEHVNGTSGVAWPSSETIRKRVGCNEKTVRDAVAILKKRGLLLVHERRRERKSNVYTFPFDAVAIDLRRTRPGEMTPTRAGETTQETRRNDPRSRVNSPSELMEGTSKNENTTTRAWARGGRETPLQRHQRLAREREELRRWQEQEIDRALASHRGDPWGDDRQDHGGPTIEGEYIADG